jgi:uncharacterized protein YraI
MGKSGNRDAPAAFAFQEEFSEINPMSTRPLVLAASLAGALLGSTALAANGVATGDVNLRTGPGTNYAKITTIPAGAPVEVFECSSWCEVTFDGAHGFAHASYISAGGYATPPVVYQPASPPVAYVPPVYAYQQPLPPRAYWRYGRPWWDDRYDAWYDGHGWWYDGDWYARPRSAVYFDFSF